MATVMKLLESVPPVWRGLLVVGAILSVGWSANALFGKASELPKRVDNLEAVTRQHGAAIDSIRTSANQLEKKVDRVLCYSEWQAGQRSVSDCIK